jgi:hypothetical protein
VRALRDRFADRLAGVEDETLSVDPLVPRLIPRGPEKKQERLRSGSGRTSSPRPIRRFQRRGNAAGATVRVPT